MVRAAAVECVQVWELVPEEVLAIDEFGDEPQPWEVAPMESLPLNLLLVGCKR